MFVLNVLKKMRSSIGMASSRIWTNHDDGDEVENNNVDLLVDNQEDEQLKLEVEKYENLERQIIVYADTFVEDKMEDFKWHMVKYDEIYSILGDKYLSLSKELNTNMNYVECLKSEIDDFNKNYKFSQRVLIELEEENVCYEEHINKLEKCLSEEYKNKSFLKYQNENQKMCLEYKWEEIAKEKKKLVETTDELNREKEETNVVLKTKLEDCANEKKKLIIEKSLQISMIDRLKKELEMEKNYGRKLNQTILCRQKNKNQELSEKVEKCKEEFELLKQISKTESNKADALINTLRAEKTTADLERSKVETEFNQNKKELEKLGCHTEQLNIDITRLQCKLDGIIKHNDVNDKSSTEKVDKKRQDVEKLTIDLKEKEQCVAELRTTLSEMRKLHAMESDEVRNLKTQLNELKGQQINTVINFGNYPGDGDHNIMINCNPQTNCENVGELDNFPSADENIINSTPFVLKRTKSIEEFEQKNRKFENLVQQCYSLVNNCF